MNLKRMIWLILIIGLLSMSVPVYAQTTVVTAISGDPSILIQYVADREPLVAPYLDGINHAISLYNEYWGVPSTPFPLFIDIVDESGGDTYAATQKESEPLPPTTDGTVTGLTGNHEVCRIRVYRYSGFGDLAKARHNAAHEVFHCYQKYLMPPAALDSINSTARESLWWFEGAAEYMASLVYPGSDSLVLSNTQSDFLKDLQNDANFFSYDYDAQFFWEYAASRGGASLIPTMLRTMPGLSGQVEHFRTQIPFYQETFQRYGVALAQGTLNVQPSIADLFGTGASYTMDAASEVNKTIELPIQPMTVEFITLDLQNLPENKAITLLYNQNSNTSRLSLDKGIPVSSDPVELCPAPAKIRLVQTETALGANVSSLALNISDCTPPPDPQIDECFVGHWALDISQGFGPVNGPKSRVLWGGYTVDILADGTIYIDMNLATLTDVIEPPIRGDLKWSAWIVASVIREGQPIVGSTLRITSMVIETNGITTTVPMNSVTNATGGMTMSCNGNTMTMTEPMSGVAYQFLRQ